MGFISRECEKINKAINDLGEAPGYDPATYDNLYAAQQALAWALDPNNMKSPYDLIMGTQSSVEVCSAEPHEPVGVIEPTYYTMHPDGSYTQADPQSSLSAMPGLLDTPVVAIESHQTTGRVGGDSAAEACVHQQ